MKNTIRSLVIAALAMIYIGSITGCQKEVMGCTHVYASNYNPQATMENGTCQYSGNAVFWFNSPRGNATVSINGIAGYITQYYPVAYPVCGSNGCANFILVAGIYSYHAESSANIWDGTMTVNANECSLILLN